MLPAGMLPYLLATSASAERIRERAASVLGSRGYQTTLPTEAEEAPAKIALGPLEVVLRVILLALLAVAVLLAVIWIVERLRGLTRDAEGTSAQPAGAAVVEFPLTPAEALAAQGRYGEAIHALLLETLAALSRSARLAPSLTSREIVARAPMPPPARDALAGLAMAVELSHFGGAEPGPADFASCLERFRTFIASYRSAA
jgi:hypothetical protein